MPAQSEQQRRAAGAALAAQRGGSSKGLRSASLSMYESMTEDELEDFASKEADPQIINILKAIDGYIKQGKG